MRFRAVSTPRGEDDRFRSETIQSCIASEQRLSIFARRQAKRGSRWSGDGGMRMESSPQESWGCMNLSMNFAMGHSRNSALIGMQRVAKRQIAGLQCSRLQNALHCSTLETSSHCRTLQIAASQRGTLQTAPRPRLLCIQS